MGIYLIIPDRCVISCSLTIDGGCETVVHYSAKIGMAGSKAALLANDCALSRGDIYRGPGLDALYITVRFGFFSHDQRQISF